MNFVCGVMEPGLQRTWPRSTSSRFVPRRSAPMLSPASPESSNLRNISTPVTIVFCVGRIPTISISSPTLTMPCSIRPVTTVPRPEIENTSSTGIRNGLSRTRTGCGMNVSIASISALSEFTPISGSRSSSAAKAEPFTIGVVSPGNSYFVRSSRISISTRSRSSLSSTMSTLFM